MRTLMIVGLVVGPVVLLGAPLALASGVRLPPDWDATAAFALAGVTAAVGLLLLALSSRPRRAVTPEPARTPAPAPAADPTPATAPVVTVPEQGGPALAPLSVVHNARPGRYVAASAPAAAEPEPVTAPTSGLVVMRPRADARQHRETVGVR